MKMTFEKLREELACNRCAVLVTITEHHGSSPRGAGAQMLVGEGGRLAGTVGGGSVEYAAQRRAAELLLEQRSERRRFELGGKEGSLDMICGGGVTVWLQYIAATDEWKIAVQTVLARLEAKSPARLVLHLDGRTATLEDSAEQGCRLEENRFSMPLPIGERAIIFGGGHCALALAPLLQSVGFRVTVFDERAEFVTRERFPLAEKLLCGDYQRIVDSVDFSGEDYIVVMTNGHRHDLAVEEQVLQHAFAYLGVMGSKKKTAAINEELLRRGVTEETLSRVHAPIGLAIKSATPEEIAVSIAGEMILRRAQRREEQNGAQGRSCPA